MTKFADKNGRVAEIELLARRTGCPWEYDFFEAGGLPRYNNPDAFIADGAYIVDDVQYLIDRATDYMMGRGDFFGEAPGHKTSTLRYFIHPTR